MGSVLRAEAVSCLLCHLSPETILRIVLKVLSHFPPYVSALFTSRCTLPERSACLGLLSLWFSSSPCLALIIGQQAGNSRSHPSGFQSSCLSLKAKIPMVSFHFCLPQVACCYVHSKAWWDPGGCSLGRYILATCLPSGWNSVPEEPILWLTYIQVSTFCMQAKCLGYKRKVRRSNLYLWGTHSPM